MQDLGLLFGKGAALGGIEDGRQIRKLLGFAIDPDYLSGSFGRRYRTSAEHCDLSDTVIRRRCKRLMCYEKL
jgi:hypothetical protein